MLFNLKISRIISSQKKEHVKESNNKKFENLTKNSPKKTLRTPWLFDTIFPKWKYCIKVLTE